MTSIHTLWSDVRTDCGKERIPSTVSIDQNPHYQL